MTMTTTRLAYDIEDPEKIQGRDEIIPGTRNLGEIRLERALDAIGEVAGRLLLPGSGAGRYARAIANSRPDLDVAAGDLSAAAVGEAIALGGLPAYVVMDAQRLPFKDATFGAVVFFDLLEHVPDPALLLSECARVLEPGGVLHFFVPLEDQPGTLYRLMRSDRPAPIHRWKRGHVGHIQRFSRNDVISAVWRAGVDVTDLSHSFHLVGQAHDVLDYWRRERVSGGRGLLPVALVRGLVRTAFMVTWRLSYLEDRLYAGPRFASGLHLTARKPAL